MLSPTSSYIVRELSSILRTSKNPETLKKFRDVILESKIPALNEQIRRYQVNAVNSIEQEIYEELMKETNFEGINLEIVDAFKKKEFHNNSPNIMRKQVPLPVFETKMNEIKPEFVADFIDGKVTQNEFREYSRLIVEDINDFEQELSEYKYEMKRQIGKLINEMKFDYIRKLRQRDNNAKFSFGKVNDEPELNFRTYVKHELERILHI